MADFFLDIEITRNQENYNYFKMKSKEYYMFSHAWSAHCKEQWNMHIIFQKSEECFNIELLKIK